MLSNNPLISLALLIVLNFQVMAAPVTKTEIKQRNDKAINFSLYDIRTNKTVKLSDYYGKVIYLDFWASWCSSCVKALPLFSQWQKELGDDFVVISVNVDEEKSDGIAMAKKLGLDYPIAYDGKLSVARMYKATALPFSFIIDKNGDIHYRHVGFRDKDAIKLKAMIVNLLTT